MVQIGRGLKTPELADLPSSGLTLPSSQKRRARDSCIPSGPLAIYLFSDDDSQYPPTMFRRRASLRIIAPPVQLARPTPIQLLSCFPAARKRAMVVPFLLLFSPHSWIPLRLETIPPGPLGDCTSTDPPSALFLTFKVS